jgi:AcrR family transcriptional regulator
MIDWNAAKEIYYRNGTPLRQIAKQIGCSERTIFRHAKEGKWFEKRQRLGMEAESVVRCQVIESARLLGAELAERTAEGFRSRTSQTIALLANRLDAMAMDGGSANEVKSIAASLRDVWTVGKELHGLSTDAPEAVVSVNILAQLRDRLS